MLTTSDINYALRLRSCEPLYGFAAGDAPRFCRAVGTSDVYFVDDPELNLADLIAAPLPAVPLEPSFSTHWLAINGVQPSVPQNPNEEEVALMSSGTYSTLSGKRKREAEEEEEAEAEAEVIPLAKHVLSQEERAWLERVFSVIRQSARPPEPSAVLDEHKARPLTIVWFWWAGGLNGTADACRAASAVRRLCVSLSVCDSLCSSSDPLLSLSRLALALALTLALALALTLALAFVLTFVRPLSLSLLPRSCSRSRSRSVSLSLSLPIGSSPISSKSVNLLTP
eukprot:6211903-Pleurochrysis_carterae.AAC.1